MNQRFLLWSLAGGAFIVTLLVSARQNELWPFRSSSSDEPRPVTAAAAAGAAAANPPSTAMPARPFAPSAAALAAATLAAPPAPQVTAQAPAAPVADDSYQTTERANPQLDRKRPFIVDPDEEEFRARVDRAADHGARSR